MAKKHNAFEDSAILNNSTYSMWFNRLYGVAINAFEWQGLPDSVDERYLEKMLFWYGQAVWFKDDILDKEPGTSDKKIIQAKIDTYTALMMNYLHIDTETLKNAINNNVSLDDIKNE